MKQRPPVYPGWVVEMGITCIGVAVLVAIAATIAIGVGLDGIRLSRFEHAVVILVLDAIGQAVTGSIGLSRITFTFIDVAIVR